MANKQKRELRNYDGDRRDTLSEEINEANEKARRERQQEVMDEKLEEMAEKALEFLQTYGEEDYRYQMMVTFLDVALQMKEAISIISSVRVATSYLSTAIQFIDDTVNFDEEFDRQMLQKSYGPFANLRRKIRARRAMRNNRRRMSTVIKNITNRLATAHLITDSLKAGFEKMRLTMLKTDEKRRKKQEKLAAKKGVPLTTPENSAAEKFIKEFAASRGISTAKKSDGEAPATGTADAGTDGGIDDIAD